ncbi:unnamed protein product [Brassicogethes aeneus]|uniref:Uncharacterized protein n=1 Tax=Brassicogethes aeneus TaxID=1431903 RepID=A0A9P0BHG9_BRAAE|nr:unnamed protein product [Brassicogethes aeneus]
MFLSNFATVALKHMGAILRIITLCLVTPGIVCLNLPVVGCKYQRMSICFYLSSAALGAEFPSVAIDIRGKYLMYFDVNNLCEWAMSSCEKSMWYKTININKLDIHILAAYQLALNYLDEGIKTRYKNLLDLQFNNANFCAFLTPSRTEELIRTASKSLPTNLHIISHTIIKKYLDTLRRQKSMNT